MTHDKDAPPEDDLGAPFAAAQGIAAGVEAERVRDRIAREPSDRSEGAALRNDDPDAKNRLLREAKTMASVRHPNLVTVHEVGEEGAHVFIAMELVAGGGADAMGAWPSSSGTARRRMLARTSSASWISGCSIFFDVSAGGRMCCVIQSKTQGG